jgi:hypothetical protein
MCVLVGMAGFEPTTSRSRTERSTKLSHIPTPPYHTRSPRTRKPRAAPKTGARVTFRPGLRQSCVGRAFTC